MTTFFMLIFVVVPKLIATIKNMFNSLSLFDSLYDLIAVFSVGCVLIKYKMKQKLKDVYTRLLIVLYIN